MQLNTLKPELLDPQKREHVFIPRFLDLTYTQNHRENRDLRIPYQQLDELTYSMKLYNFGNKIVHIGYRDGMVSTLRNTAANELMDKQCYHIYDDEVIGELSPNGKHQYSRDKMRRHRRRRVPKVRQGVYITVMKRLSTSPDIANKGISKLMADGYEGNLISGETIDSLLQSDLTTQQLYDYHPYADSNDLIQRSLQEKGIAGPTWYRGEINHIQSPRPLVETPEEFYSSGRFYDTVFVDYFIPYEMIAQSSNGVVYIEEVDLLLGTNISPIEMIHPYSKRGKKEVLLAESLSSVKETLRKHAAGVFVVNVDNNAYQNMKSVYMNLGGSIIEMKPMQDHYHDSGLYVFIKGLVREEGKEPTELEEIFIPHHQISNFKEDSLPRFYRNYTEAKTLGDLESILKEQEKERDRQRKEEQIQKDLERQEEIRRMELDYKEKLNQLELEAKQKQKEYDEAKAELDRQKQETKNYYEERGYQRKDDSENLKFWMTTGTIMIGVLAGVLLKR